MSLFGCSETSSKAQGGIPACEIPCWPHHAKGLQPYLPGVKVPELYGVWTRNWRGFVAFWAINDGWCHFVGVNLFADREIPPALIRIYLSFDAI